MAETWKSPRKVEEELRQYREERFESLMRQVEEGGMSIEVALNGLRTEIAGEVDLDDSKVEEAQESIQS